MHENEVVRDLMSDIFEYPHIPYWFTIKQAISLIKKTYSENEKASYSLGILVFDEKYVLLGNVGIKEIMGALCKLKNDKDTNSLALDESLFKKFLTSAVCDIMVPVKTYINEEESLLRTACIMIENGYYFMPVTDKKNKLTGIIKITDIFKTISLS